MQYIWSITVCVHTDTRTTNTKEMQFTHPHLEITANWHFFHFLKHLHPNKNAFWELITFFYLFKNMEKNVKFLLHIIHNLNSKLLIRKLWWPSIQMQYLHTHLALLDTHLDDGQTLFWFDSLSSFWHRCLGWMWCHHSPSWRFAHLQNGHKGGANIAVGCWKKTPLKKTTHRASIETQFHGK